MGRRRRIALIGLAAASLMLAAGSGAFSATSADRGVSVSVVDDDRAFIEVEKHPQTLTVNETPKEVTVMTFENNLPASSVTSFEAELISGDGHPAKVQDTSATWNSGTGELKATVNCGVTGAGQSGKTGTEQLTYKINIVTDGVSITLERPVEITCDLPENSESGSTSDDERNSTKSPQ